MTSLLKNSLNIRFREWQYEDFFTKTYGYISIKTLISIFIEEGLIPFILKNKYNFFINKDIIKDYISSILFYSENKIEYNLPFNNYYEEAFEQYEDTLDWNTFWKYWNFQMDNFFYTYNILIQHIVWQCIDLDNSQAYLATLDDSESEDEKNNKTKNIDPYILDQMNKVYFRKAED